MTDFLAAMKVPPANNRAIYTACRERYRFSLRLCVSIVLFVWIYRISQFDVAVARTGSPPNWGWFSAASAIVFDGWGFLSVAATAIAFLVMNKYWRQFETYLMAVMSIRRGEGYNGLIPFRVLDAVHEPPGDIFTLVGVGSTFLGLSASLVTLSVELIYGIASNGLALSPEMGQRITEAAIVFGSSLAVGLVASLHGIMLAVYARELAAEFGADCVEEWRKAARIENSHLPDTVRERNDLYDGLYIRISSKFESVIEGVWKRIEAILSPKPPPLDGGGGGIKPNGGHDPSKPDESGKA